MNSQPVTVKLTQDSSDLPGNFRMNQKKNTFLYFTWAVLILSVMILPTISCASDGDDLMTAAGNGDLSTARTLLAKGAEIDYQNVIGTTVLMRASANGHLDIVQLLLDKGARTNLRGSNDSTALIWASRQGLLEIVQALLAKGAKVNYRDKFGITALRRASENGHLDIVRVLLDKGAEIDYQDITGETALKRASYKNHLDIVQVLLDKGAKVNLQDKSGLTALNSAWTQEAKKLLKAHGATKKGWIDSIDIGGIIIIVGFLSALFYPILQFLAIRRTAGVWRNFAYLPLIPTIYIITVTIIDFNQESNLWPIVLIFAMPAIIVYLVVFIILNLIWGKKK